MTFTKFNTTAARLLLGLGICVHLLFLLSLKLGWLNGLFNDSMHRFGPGGDFFSIYAAGVKARHGESIYTVGGHVAQVPYAYAFRYAPIVAYTLGLALSFLPALNAYGLWLILCEFALLRNIRLCVERAPNHTTACLAAALWLGFTPYYLELYVGQFTFLTASLVFWAYLTWQDSLQGPAEERKRLAWFGDGCFALAVWLKMMPLLFLPLVLFRKRWKGALVTVGVLVVTSAWYFGKHPGDWAVFLDINGEPTPTWHAGNQGLMALLYLAVGERAHDFAVARQITLLVVGSGLVWLTYRLWITARQNEPTLRRAGAKLHPVEATSPGDAATTQRNKSKDLQHPLASSAQTSVPYTPHRTPDTLSSMRALTLYAACSAAYLLLYKDVWEHHYVLLLPPLVLLVLQREPARVWLPPFLLSALPTLFALYDVRGLGYNEDPQRYWLPGVSLLQHAWKPLAPVWLFGALVGRDVAAWRRREVQRGTTGEGDRQERQNEVSGGSERGNKPARMPQWLRLSSGLGLTLILIAGARQAGVAIAAQRRVTRELTWPETLFQRQQRKETCGPAALAAVCRYYGIPTTEAEIARLAGTKADGTTMLGLQQAAQAKGLSAEGQERSLEELASLPRPCLLYFHQGHFAVLTGVQNDRYYVADPSLGQRVWTKEQLAYLWRGQLLLIGPAR